MATENSDKPQGFDKGLRCLASIIYVFGINKEIWRHVDEFFVLQEPHTIHHSRLSSIIASFDLNDRVWDVLEKRNGFSKRQSLDEVTLTVAVTRERVRQIEFRALTKVDKRLDSAIGLLSYLDKRIHNDWPMLEKVNTINEAIFLYQTLLSSMGWENIPGKEIRQLLILMRALVQNKFSDAERYLPNLAFAACRLSPPILKHPKVAEQERERIHQQIEQERKWTYEELAQAVLAEAATPLHYAEIARRAESLERRDVLTIKGIHNVLLANPSKFAYVDQGTYGLTIWGLTSVDAYTDIIAEVLRTAGKPLPYGNILHSVEAKRTIKPTTLQMTLDMNPRFYYSQEKTYGLRAWLLPREKQTLRTPKWQVETPQSHERVQRSTENGYDVDVIVAQDRDGGV